MKTVMMKVLPVFLILLVSTVQASPPLSRMILSNDKVTERIGTYKMLAVRVTTAFGQEPQETMQEIEGHVFGTGEEAVENFVVRQFEAVSRGKLNYIPAVTTGVVEIKMNQKIGFYRDTEAEMVNATEALFGGTAITDVADRILFCLPDGSLGEGVWGLAQFPGRFSFFHEGGCKKLALLMHELGHNLGFDHSGIEGDVYEDRSGYMGGSRGQKINNIFKLLFNLVFRANDDRMLLKAYNGHKQWISGWFDDTKLAVDLSVKRRPFSIRLACFVDADMSDDYALLRLDNSLYLQFNCGKSYNVDTEVPNTVTVTRAGDERDVSERLASLRSGKSFEYVSAEDEYWNIQVCSIHQGDIDYAEISVHRRGEEHQCEDLSHANATPWAGQVGGAIRNDNVWILLIGCCALASLVLVTVFALQSVCGCCFCCLFPGSSKEQHPGKAYSERKKQQRKESQC